MSLTTEERLWRLSRLSAAGLALCVMLHMTLIIAIMHRGVSAADILHRAHTHPEWLLFYSLFLLCISLHAALGIRTLLTEWINPGKRACLLLSALFGLILLAMGARALCGVFG